MRDNDSAELLLTDENELYHTDCGQTVAIEGSEWRCYDCEAHGDAPEVFPGGWLHGDGVWLKAVGDGTVSIELFDDEMEDWPPLIEAHAVSADAVVIPRQDIPELAAADLPGHWEAIERVAYRSGWNDLRDRLLSGGSPAAPEDGTDG